MAFPIIIYNSLDFSPGEIAQIVNFLFSSDRRVFDHGFKGSFPGVKECCIATKNVWVALGQVLPG